MITGVEWLNTTLELISRSNPEVAEQIRKEYEEQSTRAKMIASENYDSLPVLASMSAFTVDKYSEGIVGHRYYSGCEQVDAIEQIAIDKAKRLFGAEYVNVQPCSGSDANLMAYYAIVNKYRKEGGEGKPILLSLDVDCGGHLTHSNPMNIVNELFEVHTYRVGTDGWIHYSNIESLAQELKPHVILVGYSAYPRRIDFSICRSIADRSNSLLMCDMAHFAGLVAGKAFRGLFDPVPWCDIVTSTTQKTLRSGRGGIVLAKKEWKDYLDKGCPTMMGGPLNNMIASKAVGFSEALEPEFMRYAENVVENSKVLAEHLMGNGIELLTNGTDNHMVIVNLTNLKLTGRQAEQALLECNIVTNRNAIPCDPRGSWYTSGLRIGSPALTTRGLDDRDFAELGDIIAEVLKNTHPVDNKAKYTIDEEVKADAVKRVAEILKKHPLYPELTVPDVPM